MTDTKRILPWEDDDWNWSVETQCGDLHVVQDDESGEWNAKWVYPDCDDSLGWFPDAESGMDACESAYISRCTEFLHVAGVGECVVGVKLLQDAREMIRHSGCKCPVCEGVCTNLTAAIDAASKE